MATLMILRGVPGSGKTTYAKMLEGYTRVNRDDIRFMLFGKYWGVDEDVVTDVENAALSSALRAGQNVVLDATNLNRKALQTKLSLASEHGADVLFKDFSVSMEMAMYFDRTRKLNGDRYVGEKVIKDFFKRYKINPETGDLPLAPEPIPKFEPYYKDKTLPPAYIVDTDGTVANHEGVRSPYDTSRYHLDTVHTHIANVVWSLSKAGFVIIALSGRDEKFRDVTEAWWRGAEIPFSEFHFRPQGDTRNDAIVKYELFKEHVEPYYNVLAAIDDRPRVVRMWRSIGVPVLNVGTGVEF